MTELYDTGWFCLTQKRRFVFPSRDVHFLQATYLNGLPHMLNTAIIMHG